MLNLNTLPPEILVYIAMYLSPQDITRGLGATSRRLRAFANNNHYWYDTYKKHWSLIRVFPELGNEIDEIDFKKEFIKNYESAYCNLSQKYRDLFSLVKHGDIESLKKRLSIKKNDLLIQDKNGLNVLDWARKNNHQTILNHFFEIFSAQTKQQYNSLDGNNPVSQNKALLYWAIACGQSVEIIEPLLSSDAGIDALNSSGHALLTYAVKCNQPQIVQLLIERGGNVFNDIGKALGTLEDSKKALEGYEQVLELRKKNHGVTTTSLNNIGSAWHALGEHKKGLECLEQALAIRKKVYGEEHPDAAISLNNIGGAWRALGEHNKALKYYSEALVLQKRTYGDEHPDVAISLSNLSDTYCELGNYAKSIQCLEQALVIDGKNEGQESLDVGINLYKLGCTYTLLGELDQALSTLEKSNAILHQHCGDKHFRIAIVLKYLAQAHHAKGEHQIALNYAKEALTMTREIRTKRHPDEAACLQVLGEIYLSLNKTTKAQAALKEAYGIYQERFGDDECPKTRAAFIAWQGSLNECVQSNQLTPLTLSLASTSFAAPAAKSHQQVELTTLISTLYETGCTLSYQCQDRQCIITLNTAEQAASLDADHPKPEHLLSLKNKLQAALGEMGIKDMTTQNNQIIITARSDTKIIFIEKRLQQLGIKDVNEQETSEYKAVMKT